MSLDLDAYFTRIGYAGPRTPELATLDAITCAHSSTIPFENMDVLLDRHASLEPDALFRKLVTERRGGYCFEQNGLLLEVLTQLGFRVRPLSARVRLDRPRDFVPPRTHMFVQVELPDGPRLTDVGVGALSLTRSLRLDVTDAQSTPHEARRIVREDGKLLHQVRLGDAWTDVCEFTGEEMPRIDREVAHWFTSAHPQSHFRNRLLVARAGPDGTRVTLLNDELKRRGRDGRAEVVKLRTPAELLAALREHFGLVFPEGTRFGPPGSSWPN